MKSRTQFQKDMKAKYGAHCLTLWTDEERAELAAIIARNREITGGKVGVIIGRGGPSKAVGASKDKASQRWMHLPRKTQFWQDAPILERRLSEGNRFAITRLEDRAMYFTNRKPRKDSRVWGHEYLVWDNRFNEKAKP